MNEKNIEEFNNGLNDALDGFKKVAAEFEKGWDPKNPTGNKKYGSNMEAVVNMTKERISALGMQILPTRELQASGGLSK